MASPKYTDQTVKTHMFISAYAVCRYSNFNFSFRLVLFIYLFIYLFSYIVLLKHYITYPVVFGFFTLIANTLINKLKQINKKQYINKNTKKMSLKSIPTLSGKATVRTEFNSLLKRD